MNKNDLGVKEPLRRRTVAVTPRRGRRLDDENVEMSS